MEQHETPPADAHEHQESSTIPPLIVTTGEGSSTSTTQQGPAVTSEPTASSSKSSTAPREEEPPVKKRARRPARKVPRYETDERYEAELQAKERTKELSKRRMAALATFPPEGYRGLPLGAFPDEESFPLVTRDRTDLLAKVDWEDGESFADLVRVIDPPTQVYRRSPNETAGPSRRAEATTLQDPTRTFGAQQQLLAAQRQDDQWMEVDGGKDALPRPSQAGARPGVKRARPTVRETEVMSTLEAAAEEESEEGDGVAKTKLVGQRAKKTKSRARREFDLEARRVRGSIAMAIESVKSMLAEESSAESKLIQEALNPRKPRTTYQWPVHETLLSNPTRHVNSSSAKPPDAFEEGGVAFVDQLMGRPSSSIDSESQSLLALETQRRLVRKAVRREERRRRRLSEGVKEEEGIDEPTGDKGKAPQKRGGSRIAYPAGIIKVRTKVEDDSSLYKRALSKEEQRQQWQLDRHAENRAPEIHQVFEEEVIAFAQKMYRQGSDFRVDDLDTLQELTMPKYRIQAVRSSKPTRSSSSRSNAQGTRNERLHQARERDGADEAVDEQQWADDELTAMQEKAAVFSAEDTMRRVLQRLPYVIRQGALGYKPSYVNGDFERRWETVLLAAELGGVEESKAQQLRYLTVRTKKPPTFEEYRQQQAEAKADLKHNRTQEILELIQQTERVDQFYETEGEQFKMDMYLKHLWELQDQSQSWQGSQQQSRHEAQNDEGRDSGLPMQDPGLSRMSQLLQKRTAWNEQAMPDPLHPSNDYGQLVDAAEEKRRLLERDLVEFASRWT
ncbi:hypothetical protein DFQ27_000822 [Actinomortierella ambigua]|uniref:Uncharacterized protein n=1 Tax=Actinomortierella ambigua TaxID=1343610 RepID=A0A9P6QBS5_9FUNG|nr:hypothetical protein DFQ27_000822 [Actinomortierella ambigua]